MTTIRIEFDLSTAKEYIDSAMDDVANALGNVDLALAKMRLLPENFELNGMITELDKIRENVDDADTALGGSDVDLSLFDDLPRAEAHYYVGFEDGLYQSFDVEVFASVYDQETPREQYDNINKVAEAVLLDWLQGNGRKEVFIHYNGFTVLEDEDAEAA